MKDYLEEPQFYIAVCNAILQLVQNKCFLESTTKKILNFLKSSGNLAQMAHDLSGILKFGLYL